MRQKLLFLICAAAVLASLWLVMKPAPAVHDTSETQAFYFALLDGSIPEPMVIQLKLGDTAKLSFVSDKDAAVHIVIEAGIKKDVEFVATQTGRFAMEVHVSEIQLGTIEVYPR